MIYLVCTLIGIAVGIAIPLIFDSIRRKKTIYDNAEKKRFCHHCQNAFLYEEDEGFEFCPYCGNELQYLEEYKRTIFHLSEEPFSEFNEKDGD